MVCTNDGVIFTKTKPDFSGMLFGIGTSSVSDEPRREVADDFKGR